MNNEVIVSTLCKDRFKQEYIKTMINCGFRIESPSKFWSNKLVQKIGSHLMPFFRRKKNNTKRVLVPSNGWLIGHESLPYSLLNYEIIPMLWDCWPNNINKLELSLKALGVKQCFVTSSQIVEELRFRLPEVSFVHIPEAVNEDLFKQGNVLINRTFDVWELGRPHPRYHKVLESYFEQNKGKLLGRGVPDLYSTMAETKIVVSFPQCDTNPEIAGNIETLTERYWESMFSRSLIIGRAPKELIDLLGYDPVVNVDWNSPFDQLKNILNNIDSYQELVDKNYEFAKNCGTWKSRAPLFVESLNRC